MPISHLAPMAGPEKLACCIRGARCVACTHAHRPGQRHREIIESHRLALGAAIARLGRASLRCLAGC
jgi:hypothetical protein